ncbi:MAG: gliding motility-associated protein GldE [Chitinophagaceae bacterium]|nr:gliding motility-associated protein GldE [Chitinophagaceae bacterium]
MHSHSVISLLHTFTSFLAINPQSTTFLVVLLIVLVLLAFTISGAEVALFSLNNKDVNMLKTKQHAAAKRIVTLLEEPKEVYASLLIASTFISICITILSNFLITHIIVFGDMHFAVEMLIKVLIIAFLLLFFCEVLPKIWATQNNLRFAYGSASVVEGIHLVLRRISKSVVSLGDSIGKRMGANRSEALSMREMDEAIDIKTDEEASPAEKSIMKGIVKFGNISVRQIMRSRLDVSGIEYHMSFGDLNRKIEELHYSRLPVYKVSLDEVAGIINTKDLIPFLNEDENFDWRPLVRQPYFVPESKLIEDLLRDFQSRRIHFAIVVDEFGGTSGIVTMEDILEEVIGEIRDEFDEEESGNRKLDENNYVFEGKTMIHDMCKMMRLPMDTFDNIKGESESVGGLVLELAGEFPKVSTEVKAGDFIFHVLETDLNRIRQVKVTTHHKEKD